MIAWRLGHSPSSGFGVIALKIFEDDFRELDVLASPLRFGKNDPLQWPRPQGAFLERVPEKRLRVANEANFARAKAELFPDQAHQAIAIRTAACVAVTAGRENEADLAEGPGIRWDGARQLIYQGLHHERVGWIDVIVMQDDFRMRPSSFTHRSSERLAFEQIEIERRWKYEDFSGSTAANCGGQPVGRGYLNIWGESEYWLASRSNRACVFLTRGTDENEPRSQRSFPPILPCLVMVASTSTKARTATNAVISEIS